MSRESRKVAVVGSAPDFSRKLVSEADYVVFCNAAVAHSMLLDLETNQKYWFLGAGLLTANYEQAQNPVVRRKLLQIQGSSVGTVINASALPTSAAEKRVREIAVSYEIFESLTGAQQLELIESVGLARKAVTNFAWWIETVRRGRTLNLLKYAASPRFREQALPRALKPSTGAKAIAWTLRELQPTDLLISGISWAGGGYLLDASRKGEEQWLKSIPRGHMLIDQLFLGLIVGGFGGVVVTSSSGLATGLSHIRQVELRL